MSKTNFQPIFDHIDTSIAPLKDDIAEIKADLRMVKTNLANLAGKVDTLTKEVAISNHRVKRLEDWAKPVGKKVGIPMEL